MSTQVSSDAGTTTPTSELRVHKTDKKPSKDSLHAGQPAEDEALKALSAANEKRRKNQGVGLGTNVLFFVSVLIAFVVGMYAWNKDKPKEASMFSGAPPAPAPANEGTPVVPADSAKPIGGKISLDPGLASQVDTDGVLYIIVRNAGMPTQGPPLAVRKFSQPRFPVVFTIGQENVMMKGLPFQGPFDVYVRLDRDGNAMTKGPDDLVASAPPRGVIAGDQGLEVVLNQKMVSKEEPAETPTKPSNSPNKVSATNGFSGEIKIDGSLGGGSDYVSGTVFIIVRPSGMPPVGPPLAVRKYDQPRFPLAFSIGPEHVMMENMPFTGPFDVYVRWDNDGNAMTKNPGDLEVTKPAKNVSKGANSVILVMDEKRR